MISRKYLSGAALTTALLCSSLGLGQNTSTAELKGTVTDASGAALPNAIVTVTDVQTGVVTTVQTNGSGVYDEPSLPLGLYRITFSLAGFHDFVREGVNLQLGIYGIDAKLQVGAANEQVTVNAEAPQVETESSEQSVNFDAKTVQDVPTVGGVWYNEITDALPGVNAGGGGAQSASGQGVGVNGTQGYLSTWLLDGSTATEPRDQNASNNYPPIDAIGEVNVQISNYGAQYGAGVAQFNVILKSGTNHFHGSLFEFNQNDAYNAKNYFQGTANAPLRWNEFGGSIGGPIRRDKMFFFFTYQRNPEHSSAISTETVPTAAMRTGDFSAFDATIYNPATTACTGSAASTCTRTPFSGNMIPSTAIDPVAAKIQSYFPQPNLPGIYNNYRVAVTTPGLSQWYIGKVEYDISPKNRLTGSIFEFPTTLVNSVDALCSEGFDCTYTAPRNLNQHAVISDLWTINDTTLNEAHIGGVRESDVYVPKTYDKGYPTTIGLEPAYGANAPGDIFPNVTINAGGGAGSVFIGGGTHAKLADGTYAASDILTLVRGRHTIKLGGEYDRSYQNYTNWADVSSGNFQFSGLATENPSGANDPLTGAASQGVPYADFLLGQVYGWYVYDYAETGARVWDMGGFLQDDFKLLPNLTVNLGLRYMWQSGWSEVQNRWGTFSPTTVNTGQYVNAGTLGAIVYGGQDGRDTIQNGVSEVAPRVGLSYSPRPDLAIRASYGIFDAPRSAETYTDGALGLGLNPQGSAGYGSFPTFQLKNGPPTGAVVYPKLSNLSNSQFNYQAVDYYPSHMPIQYYQEAILSVQKQLPLRVLWDTTYVFTKGTHLNFGRDIDQVPQNQLATGYAAEPYTQYTSVRGHLFDGYSNYNALQLRLEKSASYGASFGFNYAYSKTMDSGTSNGNNEGVDVWQNAYSVAANYGLSQLDATNTINGWATYELPFGSGQTFKLHGLVDEAFGGWRATGVFQVHSGIPFTPTVGTEDNSNSQAAACGCAFAWFPNVLHNPRLAHPTLSQWFDPTAFATPAAATFGDEVRNSLRGPNWRELDLSLGKTFKIRESMNFEVRADAFDALNHPNFYQPNAGVGTGVGGGGVISTAYSGRQMQLGGRYTF